MPNNNNNLALSVNYNKVFFMPNLILKINQT